MAKTEENLSQSKYAEHRKVTKGYIGRLVKEGRLHLIKGKLNYSHSCSHLLDFGGLESYIYYRKEV